MTPSFFVQNYSYIAHANMNSIHIFNFLYLIMIDFNKKIVRLDKYFEISKISV